VVTMANESILVVESSPDLREHIVRRLTQDGYDVSTVSTGVDALEAIKLRDFDLVLMEYELPDVDGEEVLKTILKTKPNALIITMTAEGSVRSAVRAIKAGAYHYLTKPIDLVELSFLIQKALETTELRREVAELKAKLGSQFGTVNLIGKSPVMRYVYSMINKIAVSGATTVLLQGESGTGKGLVARAIHAKSKRADKPFVTVTCTAIPDTLLESELFGHERGAFTDAKATRMGQFELADGGTIFLDEIGDMSLALQAKLLRFIDEKKFTRVGGTREIEVDVRIIAATNRPLDKLVEQGKFRDDLYFRLKIIPLTLPPLRQRKEDIPLLAQAFIEDFNREFGKRVKGLDNDALQAMMAYNWPGNVRELRNVIERAVLLTGHERLTLVDVFPEHYIEAHRSPVMPLQLPPEGINLHEVEKSLICQALTIAHGKQTTAAKLLGITRDQLRSRIKKYALSPREFKK